MEKKEKRMDLMKNLAKFLLEKDLKNCVSSTKLPALLRLELKIKDTLEFGNIIVSLNYRLKKFQSHDHDDMIKEIEEHDDFSFGSANIHGHKKRNDKAFDFRLNKILYNGQDYGDDEVVKKLWISVGHKIAKTILESQATKITKETTKETALA